MKKLLLICISILFASCSFDNKTGIWKDASNILLENQDTRSIEIKKTNNKYEDFFSKKGTFNEEKKSLNFSNFQSTKPIKVKNWVEQFATPTNNISNFFYADNKILLSKSRKLSSTGFDKNYLNSNIVFYKNNLISYDHKGTIFIYSLSLKKKIFKYNFYKKNFKNIKKKINLLINKNFLYVSDNLGYLYAINLDNNSIVWAKNYGIPFRSNLKFMNNQIFLANQDNYVYSIDSYTGNKNWQFATSPTFLKSDFENNFALDPINNNLFFLNTSGELYSFNHKKQNINWVLNFRSSAVAEDTELFLSQPMAIKNNNIIITTKKTVLSYDTLTGSRNWLLPAESIFKPIITLNYTYFILKNNLLICLDNTDGNVVWSQNIFSNTEDKKVQEKFHSVVDFKIVNNKINVYSKNGYLLSFIASNGNLSYLSKISKNGINSEVVFLDENMLFMDNSNKLLKFN